ncbi:MAG: acyl-CoA thioesterase [Ilumatobacteraceae bacterium]
MDPRPFLSLQPSHNPFRWSLDVRPDLCTMGGFLFGGVGLGAAIAALEGTSERSCIWATGQYLSYAAPGEVMDIDVTIAVAGHQITQARAVGHVGNREILTVNAALGVRPDMPAGQWEQMPAAAPPAQCKLRSHRMPVEGTIHERLEQRTVTAREFEELDGDPGDGQTVVWARIPDVIAHSGGTIDAATLAVLGDHVPMGVGQALGVRGGGNSLDNTLRVARLVPTEWVLLDIRVHAVERGFGHGLVHMFADDGTLLATASQSCIVRFWKDQRRALPSQ